MASVRTSMTPAVTVVLPVYNGARYLRETLDSLLAQDYPAFQIVVVDNASTDSTVAIANSVRTRRPALVLHSYPRHVGMAEHFTRALLTVDTPYVCLAGADDRWHPTFLSRCLAEHQAHPGTALVHSEGQEMTMEGKPFGTAYQGLSATSGSALARWQTVLRDQHFHMAIYGVMRTTALRTIPPYAPIWGADQVVVASLSLYGAIRQVPQTLWWHRRPEHISHTQAIAIIEAGLECRLPKNTQWQLHRGYARALPSLPQAFPFHLAIAQSYLHRVWKQDVQDWLRTVHMVSRGIDDP